MVRSVALAVLSAVLAACPQTVTTPAEPLDASGPPLADAGGESPSDASAPQPDAAEARPDASAPDACTPECGALRCGIDPVCGQPCGTCAGDQACTAQGECVDSCAVGTSSCTPDGVAYRGCGLNEALGIPDYGARTACSAGEQCQAGRCSHDRCLPAQVVLVVDRSASLGANAAWTWVKDELLRAAGTFQNDNAFGVRAFPGPTACGAAPLVVPHTMAVPAIDRALDAPGTDASSPIAAALHGIGPGFMGQDDGRAVVLITDGDETCASGDDAVRAASILARSGVRTYPIAVSSSAHGALLDRIAAAGNTGAARRAHDAGALRAALAEVLADIGACRNARPKIGMGFYHGCALRADGTAFCWGRQDERVRAPSGRFRAIASSTDASCAAGLDGRVACWGRDLNGQLAPPGGAFVQLAGGDSHFCGLRSDGTIVCWGNDDDGQATAPAGTFRQVATMAFGSCGLLADGSVRCWGRGVAPSGRFTAIDGGSWSLCGLGQNGEIECSGAPAGGAFEQLAQGYEHGCAIDGAGAMRCWGNDGYGQSSMIPPGRWVSVDVNYYTTCAARDDDQVLCWGDDSNGQASPP